MPKTQYIINYMNKSIGTMVMATSLLFGACSGDGKTCDRATQQKGNTENVIGRSDIKVKDGRMTPEVLWAMGRIGGTGMPSAWS